MSQGNMETVMRDLGDLKQELTSYEKEIERGSLYWKIGGAILLLFVFSYLTYAYVQVRSLLKPENIAMVVDGFVTDKAPVIIKDGANSLIAMAPDVIDTGKNQAFSYMPLARMELESSFESMVKEAVVEFGNVVNKSLGDTLGDPANKPLVLLAGRSPKAAENLVDRAGKKFTSELDKALREETGRDLNKNLVESQKQLTDIRDKLRKLRDGKNLNAQERLERHFLQLVLVETQLSPDTDATTPAPVKAGGKKAPAKGKK